MSGTIPPSPQFCPVCNLKGITSTLKLYQINENEALPMCTNRECSYPVGTCDPASIIVKKHVHGLAKDPTKSSNEKCTKSPSSSVSSAPVVTVAEDDTTKNELDLMLEEILSEENKT